MLFNILPLPIWSQWYLLCRPTCMHFMHNPRDQHVYALRWTLRYTWPPLNTISMMTIVTYNDIYWGWYPKSWRSISYYCVFLADNFTSLYSKHQLALSRSNFDAKYHHVVNVILETCWLLNIIIENNVPSPRILLCIMTMLLYFNYLRIVSDINEQNMWI